MEEIKWNEILHEFEEVMTQESIVSFCNRKSIKITEFKRKYEKYVTENPNVTSSAVGIEVEKDYKESTLNFVSMLESRNNQKDKFLSSGIKLVCNGVEIYLQEGYDVRLFSSLIKKLKVL